VTDTSIRRKNLDKLLTIIVPAYNAEKFLHKCLASFIIDEENLKKLQVIVVNDGSKDATHEIAAEYADKYSDVFEIIDKQNAGHGSAINAGVKKAVGKFFKVIDADDWVLTQGLALFMHYLEKCDADAVISDYYTYDIKTGRLKEFTAHSSDAGEDCTLGQVMCNWKALQWGMTFHGISYNTSFYRAQQYELAEQVFYEDQEYAAIPMCRAVKIRFSQIMLYVYRVGDVTQSVSEANQIKRIGHLEKVILKMLEYENEALVIGEDAKKYWLKKTTMAITSFYQIALIKNPDKKGGRGLAAHMSEKLENTSEFVYNAVHKKIKIFLLLNYLHVPNKMYEDVEHIAMGILRRK
jgi:glycosyltransferase involved in cell wall biosynthesis